MHVESDQGGHTLHLVSGAFNLFNRKRRRRKIREFNSCECPLQLFRPEARPMEQRGLDAEENAAVVIVVVRRQIAKIKPSRSSYSAPKM